MKATPTDRIESLKARRAAIDARIQRLESRDALAIRKLRSRALLLLGVAMEKHVKEVPTALGQVHRIVDTHLLDRERKAVREYFGWENSTE